MMLAAKKAREANTIDFVAQSLSVELSDLQIYSMTTKEREVLQKKIDERMAGSSRNDDHQVI